MSFISIFKSNKEITHIKKNQEIVSTLPKSLQIKYTANYGTFENWCKNNRDHQNKAFNSTNNSKTGQISLPTGTGKTRVQIQLHVAKMIEMTQNNQFGAFVIGAHRLALCSQLLTELIEVTVNAGIPFDILFVGSDRYSEDKVHFKFRNKGLNSYVNKATSTTNQNDILNAYNSATQNNRQLIVVSTYHSWHRLNILDEIVQATYDEAHTLIVESFFDNITKVKPKIEYNYFFTATRKVQGDSQGMNNTEFFGEVICEISPRKMIQKGEIVPPKIHIIQTEDTGDYNNHSMLIKTVISGYQQHKYLVTEHSNNFETKLGAKVLISTTGNLEMFELHNDEMFKSFCIENHIKVFAFSSQEGVFYNFGKINRTQALEFMNEMTDDEDAIMMHIDILTEGIDVPSVTGVMPFRELNNIKLLQTIGRGARLLKTDRQNLYNGSIGAMDFDNYVKPCVWVILPEHFRSLGNSEAMKNTIKTIVNSYEIPVEEYNVRDRYLAISDDDLDRITEIDHSTRKDSETGLVHTIEDILNNTLTFEDIKQNTTETIGNVKDAILNIFK